MLLKHHSNSFKGQKQQQHTPEGTPNTQQDNKIKHTPEGTSNTQQDKKIKRTPYFIHKNSRRMYIYPHIHLRKIQFTFLL